MRIRYLKMVCRLFGLFLVAAAQARPPAQAAVMLPLRVNVGSYQAYTASDGAIYLPDLPWDATTGYGFVGGRAVLESPARPVGGSPESSLFQSYREGWQAYHVGDLPDGAYLVTLRFIEHSATIPPVHVFDVALEGNLALDDVNVSAEIGLDYVLTRRLLTHVSDGQLDLTAAPVAGTTLLAALEVAAFDDDGLPPAAPTGVTTLSSYRAVLVNWPDSAESDADGYHVYRADTPNGPYTRLTDTPLHLSRLEDSSAVIGNPYFYQVSAVDASGRESALSAPVGPTAAVDPSSAGLPRYELEVSAENLAFLYANPYTDDAVPATVSYNGAPYAAEVRFRGNYGREVTKRSWKVGFTDASPLNSDRINLNGEYVDWTLMRTLLTNNLYESAGIQPPHMEPVLVFLNGRYQGVYIQIEQVDEAFLERTGRDPGSNIYKSNYALTQWLADPVAYIGAYEEETNEDGNVNDLIQFSELINFASEAEFPYAISHTFDLWHYLDYYAINVLVTNTDFTWHNAYLIHDLAVATWALTPWDLDHTWGLIAEWTRDLTTDMPLDMGSAGSSQRLKEPSPLLTRLLAVPAYRDYYCGRLNTLLQTTASEATLFPQIDALYATLQADVRRDWQKYRWDDNSWFEAGPDDLKQYLTLRRAQIEANYTAYCQPTDAMLFINEVLPVNVAGLCDPDDPDSADCHESWFEIYNAGLTAVDLHGMYLTDAANQPTKQRIDGALVLPPLGYALIWADGEPAQGVNHVNFELAAGGGFLALIEPTGSRELASAVYGSLPADVAWGRAPDGVTWRTLQVPSPGEGNHWRGPTITDVGHAPAQPATGESVTVSARISDDGNLTATQLFAQVGNGAFTPQPLTDNGGGLFSAVIPGQADGARVQYYLAATDNDGLTTLFPPAQTSWRFGVEARPDTPLEFIVNYQPPTLQLNEFMADNATGLLDPNEPGEFPDWLEIYNPGPHAVNLGGLTLTDNLSKPTQFRLSPDLAVAPGGYLLLYADNDPEQGLLHTNFSLKTTESLGLFDAARGLGAPLDTLSFSGQQTDIAYGRCPDGDGGWEFIAEPSPGLGNAPCGVARPAVTEVVIDPAYPDSAESVAVVAKISDNGSLINPTVWFAPTGDTFTGLPMTYVGGIQYRAFIPPQPDGAIVTYYITTGDDTGYQVIYPADAPTHRLSYVVGYARPPISLNEIMLYNTVYVTDPDEAGETPDWIELYNAGPVAFDLTGFSLTDDSAEPTKYPVPAGVTIPAGGFLTFWADDDTEQGALHTNFTLPYIQGAVALYGADGRMLIDRAAITLMPRNRSWGRTLDGGGTWAFQKCPSLNATNRCLQHFLPLVRRP